MPGIEYATVLIDEISQKRFRGTKQSTASVAVMPLPDRDLDAQQVRAVRQFVASAVGLEPSSITVLNQRRGLAYPVAEPANSAFPDRAVQARRLEEHWSEKLRSLLAYIPGAAVTVSAQYPTHPIPDLKRPIATENKAIGEPAALETLTTSNLADGAVSSETKPILRISIGIPKGYFLSILRSQTAQPAYRFPSQRQQEIEKATIAAVRESVEKLLPPSLIENPSADLHIHAFDEPMAAHGLSESDSRWLVETARTYWLLPVIIVATLGLLLMYLRHRSSSVEVPVADTVSLELSQRVQTSPAATRDESDHENRTKSPRDRLISAVQADPESAVEVLRKWIGKAG